MSASLQCEAPDPSLYRFSVFLSSLWMCFYGYGYSAAKKKMSPMESKPFNKHIKALLSKSKYMLVRGERWAEMTGQFEHRVRHGGRQTGRKSMSHILHEHICPSITKQCRTDSPLCLYRHSRQSCGAGHTWRHCTSLCVCLLSYTRSLVLKKRKNTDRKQGSASDLGGTKCIMAASTKRNGFHSN